MAQHASPQVWSNSNAYEAIMGRWSRPAAEAVLAWQAAPAGLSWLDVGCGTGALTRLILDTADPADVLGVDPSAEFLALAAELVDDERVTFAVGNAVKLPAPDARYDAVISGLVLHFVPDPEAALIEMTRVARGGGSVTGYIWRVDDEEQFTRPFWRAAIAADPASAAEVDPGKQFALRRPEQLADLFAAAGLVYAVVEPVDVPVVFRDFDDYWQPCLLDGATPIQRYARSRTAEQQRELAEHLRATLPIASDGSIPLQGRLWVARGWKPA